MKLKPRTFVSLLALTLMIAAAWFFFALMRGPFPASLMPMPSGQPVFGEPIHRFAFESPQELEGWEERVFDGKTEYQIVSDSGGGFALKASTRGNSSGLFRAVHVPVSMRPMLTWEWKVTQFPTNKKNEKLGAKADNDFGARVYVVFEGRIPMTADIIQYIWDDHFPEGSQGRSPYSRRVKYLVVENAKAGAADAWVKEERDIVRDYEMLFGKKPRRELSAIGVMSDADNTKTQAEAYYRNMAIFATAVSEQ